MEQLKRYPYPFPQLEINPDVKDIENFQFSDFKLINYLSHPKIKMEMAV
jgi:thymidylate synthase